MTLPEPRSSARELGPGDVLGRYELLLPIAEGGMAMVWAARLRGSRGFGKTVAIKTMLPELSADAQFEKMFLDEARIASGIRHANVAEILDLGEEQGRLYLVLEWVDGEPLANLRRDAVRDGGMPLGVAVRIVAGACAGLHAAHERVDDHTGQRLGLVHRDISPQNVLVTFDGATKVVDFGVAKAAGRSSEKTLAGHVKGKPPYMSPEQASGMDVDCRTDIFALGILLYQLVTGKHPFRGESDLVTLQNIVSNAKVVSPRAHNPECPKQLERVISKAIEHHAEDRWASALEMEQALEECLPDLPFNRQSDVARFVHQASGERGERRRQQIREAIAVAEERSGGVRMRVATGRVSELGEIDPHGRTLSRARATQSDDLTQVAEPEVARTTRRAWPIALALVAVLGVVAATYFGPTPVASIVAEVSASPSASQTAGGGKAPEDAVVLAVNEPPSATSLPEVAAVQSEGASGASAPPRAAFLNRVPAKKSPAAASTEPLPEVPPKSSNSKPAFAPPPVGNPGF